ncbi:MAG: SPW repeat protein, partial [Bacteroidota bacterium]|nr:SPW repeat protein [Bacteroidota bacterium]
TMPWMVMLFGILVIPLGVTSIILMMLQPVAVGSWCFLCLGTAVAMLIMVPLTLDEVVAMIQFLVRKKREGKNFWTVFWMGDTVEGGERDTRSPGMLAAPSKTIPAMFWGITVPWSLLLATALGLWIIFTPAALGITGIIADSHFITGAMVITFSVIAMAEVTRNIRFLNILFGIWIIAAPFILGEETTTALWNGIATGILLIALSFPKGKIKESYGTYDKCII